MATARQFYNDTTSQEYATWQDVEQENQRNWFEEFHTEAELREYLPAAAEYLHAIHMECPF